MGLETHLKPSRQVVRDFFETFAPGCKCLNQADLGIDLDAGLGALDLDAEAAFVSRDLGDDEEVFMKIPPGFESRYGKGKVLRHRGEFARFLSYQNLSLHDGGPLTLGGSRAPSCCGEPDTGRNQARSPPF